jgi:hypothetical protein
MSVFSRKFDRFLVLSGVSFLWACAGTPYAFGCTACMGASNSALGEAANGAIFVMLGVLALVLGLISLAGYSLVRRSRLPMPPHQELARSLSESNLTEV